MSAAAGVSTPGRRIVRVFLAVVIGVAFAGFLVGTRPSDTPASASPVAPAPALGDAPPAPRYGDKFAARRAGTASPLPALAVAVASRRPPMERAAADDVERALAARASRRAYDGAPPVVPHAIDQTSAASCLACHADGMEVDGRTASRMSHAAFAGCTQCHVESENRRLAPREPAENAFAGLAAPVIGARAWAGAPPTMPHPTWMREDCLACHGPAGRAALRTSHPERRSCTQCHTPSAALEQRTAGTGDGPR